MTGRSNKQRLFYADGGDARLMESAFEQISECTDLDTIEENLKSAHFRSAEATLKRHLSTAKLFEFFRAGLDADVGQKKVILLFIEAYKDYYQERNLDEKKKFVKNSLKVFKFYQAIRERLFERDGAARVYLLPSTVHQLLQLPTSASPPIVAEMWLLFLAECNVSIEFPAWKCTAKLETWISKFKKFERAIGEDLITLEAALEILKKKWGKELFGIDSAPSRQIFETVLDRLLNRIPIFNEKVEVFYDPEVANAEHERIKLEGKVMCIITKRQHFWNLISVNYERKTYMFFDIIANHARRLRLRYAKKHKRGGTVVSSDKDFIPTFVKSDPSLTIATEPSCSESIEIKVKQYLDAEPDENGKRKVIKDANALYEQLRDLDSVNAIKESVFNVIFGLFYTLLGILFGKNVEGHREIEYSLFKEELMKAVALTYSEPDDTKHLLPVLPPVLQYFFKMGPIKTSEAITSNGSGHNYSIYEDYVVSICHSLENSKAELAKEVPLLLQLSSSKAWGLRNLMETMCASLLQKYLAEASGLTLKEKENCGNYLKGVVSQKFATLSAAPSVAGQPGGGSQGQPLGSQE